MNGAEKWAVIVTEFRASGKSQRYWLERFDEISEGEEIHHYESLKSKSFRH